MFKKGDQGVMSKAPVLGRGGGRRGGSVTSVDGGPEEAATMQAKRGGRKILVSALVTMAMCRSFAGAIHATPAGFMAPPALRASRAEGKHVVCHLKKKDPAPGTGEELERQADLLTRRRLLSAAAGILILPVLDIFFGAKAAHAAVGTAKGERAPPADLGEVLKKAAARAIGGGRSGAAAGVLQVLSLMWLRTTMNYQYRYGGSMSEVMAKLYKEGGVGRFYRGVGFALLQQPLSRFGDTAANAGMVVLLESFDRTREIPPFVKTVCASAAAALWRIWLMPIDSFKTNMQVCGDERSQEEQEIGGMEQPSSSIWR